MNYIADASTLIRGPNHTGGARLYSLNRDLTWTGDKQDNCMSKPYCYHLGRTSNTGDISVAPIFGGRSQSSFPCIKTASVQAKRTILVRLDISSFSTGISI